MRMILAGGGGAHEGAAEGWRKLRDNMSEGRLFAAASVLESITSTPSPLSNLMKSGG